MAIVALLLTLAVPRYFGSIDKSKEAVLKENLHQMRDAISKYYADKGRYPESLESLATDKYLRQRADRPDHREHHDLDDRAARGPDQGRRLRREERRAGQEQRRQRVFAMVKRARMLPRQAGSRQAGFTYLTVMFVVAILLGGLAIVGEIWETSARREKEAELLFIGNQYRRAIGLYYLATPGAPRRTREKLEDLSRTRASRAPCATCASSSPIR